MSGRIEVVSNPGDGSSFTIELPAERSTATLHEPALPPAVPAVALAGHVLYVDDNPVNLQLVESILAEFRPGLELRTAAEGEAGFRLVQERKPDLLLLDLNLPDISGEEVLRRLRAETTTANIPVLIVSADSTSRNITRLLQTGADAYLTKPLDVNQFIDLVDRMLRTP
jgi:CheY-like chemotaxis protein